MSGSFDPGYAGAPTIERVSLEVGGVAGLLVRVEGRWSEAASSAGGAAAMLLVRGDRRQFRFPALPSAPAADGAWRATFSVPAELRPALERELFLELGALAVRLPAPVSPDVQPPVRSATVVDRGVIAERRARRAEGEVERLESALAELRRTQSGSPERMAELEERVARLAASLRDARRRGRAALAWRSEVLAREAVLAARLRGLPVAPPLRATPLAPAPALALERAMARPNDSHEGVGLGRRGASLAGGALRLGELFTSTAGTPGGPEAPPATEPPPSRPLLSAGAPDPDRLEAARERLRTAPIPALSGPPDASRFPRALRTLARRDPAAGGRLLAALVPAQDLAAPASYVLALRDVGRVTAGDGETAVRVETDAAGLARLILSRPPRRLLARRVVRIDGRRRRATRPLRRLARTPLPWGKLAAAEVILDPGLAYRWIALATDPKWTRGERFTVAHTGDEDRPWYIRADDGRPLSVTAVEPRDRPAAEIECADADLAAFLAQAPGHPARVTGDTAAVALLLAWANGRPR